jgi:hypothetical protein
VDEDSVDDGVVMRTNALEQGNKPTMRARAAQGPSPELMLPCTVNGRPVQALLDSGANIVALSTQLVEELDLVVKPMDGSFAWPTRRYQCRGWAKSERR